MVIYLDLILLSNFLINFLFLSFIEKLFNDKIKYLRITIASVIGSLFVLVYFTDYIYLFICKLIGGILITIIGLVNITKSKQIIKICLFYALNFAFVGFLQSFKINDWYLLLVAIIVILGLFVFENSRKYFIFINRCKYNVIVLFENCVLSLESFLDTGNECFYNNTPVIFINQRYKPSGLIAIGIMNINTVSGNSSVEVYKPLEFWVIINKKKIKKDVYVLFSDFEKDCLLGSNLLI